MNDSSAAKILKQAAGECTCFNLRKVTRAVTQRFDDILQPSGLRATQFTLLTALKLSGSATVSVLAERLVMDRTTLTRNLKPLESRGWVKAVPGEDRRTRQLTLTARGQRVLVKATPLWQKAQGEVMQALGKKHWGSLMDELSFALTRIPMT